MIILDYKDRRPLYEQIVDKFSDMILKGILKPDDKMPSVRSLAMELSINPNTIQRAYMELEHRGFLYSVKGRGNFVSDSGSLKEERKKEIIEQLISQLKEAWIHGITLEKVNELIFEVYNKPGEPTSPSLNPAYEEDEKYQRTGQKNSKSNRITNEYKGGERND